MSVSGPGSGGREKEATPGLPPGAVLVSTACIGAPTYLKCRGRWLQWGHRYAAPYFVCAASDAGDARQAGGAGHGGGGTVGTLEIPVTHVGRFPGASVRPPRCSARTAPGKHSLRPPTPPQRGSPACRSLGAQWMRVQHRTTQHPAQHIAQHAAQHTAQQHSQNTPTCRPSGGEHQISLLPSHFFLPSSSHSIPRSLSSPSPKASPARSQSPFEAILEAGGSQFLHHDVLRRLPLPFLRFSPLRFSPPRSKACRLWTASSSPSAHPRRIYPVPALRKIKKNASQEAGCGGEDSSGQAREQPQERHCELLPIDDPPPPVRPS